MYKILNFLKIYFFKLTLERFPNIYRPSSNPYISGDTFRKFAKFVFDETKTFDPGKVENNDVVFVRTDLIDNFFNTIHNKISSNYVLLTHNSDLNITKDIFEKYFDSKIAHWFTQNLCFDESENISLIPIGLENRRRLKSGRKIWFKDKNSLKSKNILASFDIYTNYEERFQIQELLKDNEIIHFDKFAKTKDYFNNLKDYRFILCPPGNGVDTHRIWESLLMNTIPILKNNNFSKNLINKKVPVLVVDDWKELNDYDENYFVSEYEKIFKNSDIKKFSTSTYWIDKINNI